MADTKDNVTPTVEMSLEILSDVVAKAVDDLEAAHGGIEMARADIVSRNSTVSRGVIVAATRAVDQLRRADEALRDVLEQLAKRG